MQQVPQFIDVEDKIAGPFTWRQLVWFVACGGILVFLWRFLDKAAFYVSAFPIVLLTAVLAFYRPQNMSFVSYAKYALIYFFKPRLFLWQREIHPPQKKESKQAMARRESQELLPTKRKPVSTQDIQSLTQALDSHGEHTNARLQELLKLNAKKEKVSTNLLGKLKQSTKAKTKKKKADTDNKTRDK